ncbi:hypothetical protein ASF49_08410 [Methylobacterium sp. Leaf104]|nr:hypothetical protein ASF49_08410 [Methylobacterium sp. Leaf104]
MLLASAVPSASEPWLKPLFVRLPPLAVEGDQGRPAVPQTRAALQEANAKAAALMNAFEHRIGQKAHRAMSSICQGCALSAQAARRPIRPMEATALTEEHIVDDPAQAPAD